MASCGREDVPEVHLGAPLACGRTACTWVSKQPPESSLWETSVAFGSRERSEGHLAHGISQEEIRENDGIETL